MTKNDADMITKEALQARGFAEQGDGSLSLGWTRDLNTSGDANARILISSFFPLNRPAISLQVGGYTLVPTSIDGGLKSLDALIAMFDACHVDSAIGYEKDMEQQQTNGARR